MRRLGLMLVAGSMLMAIPAMAQDNGGRKWAVKGSVQSDVLIPQEDAKIGTGTYDEWGLTNTYADVNVLNKYFTAGLRFEFNEFPLPGFEPNFKGWGVPYYYVSGNYKGFELTAGHFYDQFGSGLILRTYEERSLGIDNSLRGGRLVVDALKGVRLKVLGGQQRQYWDYSDSWVYGGDVELNIDQWSKRMQEKNAYLMLGFSAVSRHQKSEDILLMKPGNDKDVFKLNLPENVQAYDVRARFQKGNYNFLAEYAIKAFDPSFDNNYTYRNGSALLLSGSYSKRGMSILLQAKRSEDMSYRSERSVNGVSSFINHLPAFAYQHTYSLAALYPYATQPGGEWAYQAELSYNFKRRTAMGGKYGTTLKLNFSHIRGLDKKPLEGVTDVRGTSGYSAPFFRNGDLYYQDVNVQLDKKITRKVKLNAMYMFQKYNRSVVEGHGGMINSHIGVVEGKFQFNRKLTLRAELQYLGTSHESGDWMSGLVELSILPYFMITVSDMYGRPEIGGVYRDKEHYYMASLTFNYKAHRLMAGYGKTRAGYNCSGGVCRYVPASKGLQLSYNFNF